MDGKFEVTTIISSWEPPFDKKKTVVEYQGMENEEFDEDGIVERKIFQILALKDRYALIRYNHQYTLKRNQFTQSDLVVEPGIIKLPLSTPLEFSYMWGNKGTTKKITYSGLVKGDN